MVCAHFKSMRNSGRAFNGATLGPMDTFAGWLNNVEITFKVTNARIAAQYRNIRAYQWSGPEAIWIQASSGDWKVYKSGPGTGEDLPEPENKQYKPAWGGSPGIVAYYDSPVCILKTDEWSRYPGACGTGIGWISTSTPPFID